MNLEDAIKQIADKYQLDESIVKDLGLLFATQLAEAVEAAKQETQVDVEALVEARVAGFEADQESQLREAIEEFINEDIAQELEDAKRYREMRDLVENLREAFAQYGLSVEQLDERVEQTERMESLLEENEQLRTQLDEQKCSTYLITALNESGLSDMQKDKIMSTLSFTSPKSVSEFKGIVDHLIIEAKKLKEEDDDEDDDKDDDDMEEKKGQTKKGKLNESDAVSQYANYLKRYSPR